MANITDQQVASTDSTEGTAPAWFDQGVDLRKLPDEVEHDEEQREKSRKSRELIWLEESAELALRDYLQIWDCHDQTTADDWLARQLRDFPELRPWEHYIRTGTPLADGTLAAQSRDDQPASAHEDQEARQDRRLQEFESTGGVLEPNTYHVRGRRGALSELVEKEKERGNSTMASDSSTLKRDLVAAAARRSEKLTKSGLNRDISGLNPNHL